MLAHSLEVLGSAAYPFKLSPAMVKKFAPPPSGQAGRPHDEDASTLPTAVVTTEGDTAPATTAPESEHANSSSSSTTTNYDADATIESTSSLKATLLSTDSPKKVCPLSPSACMSSLICCAYDDDDRLTSATR